RGAPPRALPSRRAPLGLAPPPARAPSAPPSRRAAARPLALLPRRGRVRGDLRGDRDRRLRALPRLLARRAPALARQAGLEGDADRGIERGARRAVLLHREADGAIELLRGHRS